ncbi:MAG: UDP-N-acetylglucosamine--N-acetylmuramyl-(pentapeptide) pyrophosphoryl-undecaprenol [Patescibacteria group bacterium]|nr:UDP-N-acetylglucosamine--N-acetylmuramyl-(pentapeptide) pyrophosphoryl-undecaprenol [Patescibacteria group bacterium]
MFAIGGSLGSARVFEAVFAAAEILPEYDFEIVLGKLNTGLRKKFSQLPNVVCHDFLAQVDMAKAYAKATLVITRAGATSLAEIEASGTDMLIVPLEGSANGHQRANAAAYAAKGYSVILEKDIAELPKKLKALMVAARSVSMKKSGSAGEGIARVIRTIGK